MLYWLNGVAVGLHTVNAIICVCLSATILDKKPSDVIFVSGTVKLKNTNFAMVDTFSVDSICPEVVASPHFQHRVPYADLMPHYLYDFRKCFGVLQSAILFLRMFEHPDWLDYIHDLCNIILSIVAKTFLAYALIGPALSMNELT